MSTFIEILKVILLGVVEGITEWLPISSTGHMILIDEFVKLNVRPEFMEVFLVVIQLGAILAVVLLFWGRLWPFCSLELTAAEKKKLARKPAAEKVFWTFVLRFCNIEKWIPWLKIFIACIPTILIGFPLNDWIEEKFNNYFVVAVTLIVYGILFIVIENVNQGRKMRIRKMNQMDYLTAFGIGWFQVLALIPGTSRSGATILGGMLLGASRTVAAEFTFYLAIPTMFGASLLKLIKFGFSFTAWEVLLLLIGMLVAFIVSIFAIKFLLGYIRKKDFKAFGWYRIGLGILVLVYFVFKRYWAG